jgi:prevent-host-death family protein
MKQVSLYEAKTHLSKLVEEAAAGEEIVIAKNGKPLARLIGLAPAKVAPRRLGLWDEANKNYDWDKWEKTSRALDKEIEHLFNEGDVPSALDEFAPPSERKKMKGFGEKAKRFKTRREGPKSK